MGGFRLIFPPPHEIYFTAFSDRKQNEKIRTGNVGIILFYLTVVTTTEHVA